MYICTDNYFSTQNFHPMSTITIPQPITTQEVTQAIATLTAMAMRAEGGLTERDNDAIWVLNTLASYITHDQEPKTSASAG